MAQDVPDIAATAARDRVTEVTPSIVESEEAGVFAEADTRLISGAAQQ